ncbi:MAG: RDD family protein, partial [Vicinamibacterales bacterium]
LWDGRTVGKQALGLRVRTKEGAPVRFRHAAIRGALSLIDFYLTLGLAATLSVLLNWSPPSSK